jgi:uncharacterized membrane protein
MELDLAVFVFDSIPGAEHAFADARDRARGEPWLNEVAFVERHRRDRIAMRGTVLGHYVDIDDLGEAVGRDAAVGALTGALVGLLLGPVGLAPGVVVGGAVGGLIESVEDAPHPQGPLFDEVRHDIPEGSSAVILLAAPEDADAMVKAFEGLGGRLIRRRLTTEAVDALLAAVADAPAARFD